MRQAVPRALTIAGSDSGGGAGIQADLKTFAALGVYGTCAITALTAQNTRGVTGVQAVPPEFVGLQMSAVLDDIGADAVKTGMLATREIVLAVGRAVKRYDIKNLVVDPVFVSKHGYALLCDDALEAFVAQLLPLALIATPNVPEAERLVGFAIKDRDGQYRAARAIARIGPRYVLLKGGHLADSDSATDVLCDGVNCVPFAAPRIATVHTHGTGCVLSAAIAAYLALGQSPEKSVAGAKEFVTRALKRSLAIGGGIGPVNPTL